MAVLKPTYEQKPLPMRITLLEMSNMLEYVRKIDKRLLLTPIKKAAQRYDMLKQGDRIAVGMSGGKDSTLLFYMLTMLQRQLPIEFELVPICITLGFKDMDITPLAAFVESLGNRLHVKDTLIGNIIFDIRKEKNPCSLCSKMRNGALHNVSKSLGCNKVALGHHLDDAIETFLMNLVFTGRLSTLRPKAYLDRKDITVIRPMILLEERTIANAVNAYDIPTIESKCPANKKTKREDMKELVKGLSLRYPDIRYKFIEAFDNADASCFWQFNTPD
jgi:tRNA 2-thiocytidine biosynthesis protein TtcA